eukprot:6491442-Prymnesium_polylepis.2
MSTPIPFFMYTQPALDQSWLRHCDGFEDLKLSMHWRWMAEATLAEQLAAHTWRTADPERARLFFVPVLEYTSGQLEECNGTSHHARMATAGRALRSSRYWQRSRGRDHFFAAAAMNHGSPPKPLAQRIGGLLSGALMCGTAGRYKEFPWGGRSPSAGALCSVEVPLQASVLATHAFDALPPAQRWTSRRYLLHFSGTLDVCCTGAVIRCKVADLVIAARGQPDVLLRPALPTRSKSKNGTSTAVAWGRAGACAQRLLTGLSKVDGLLGRLHDAVADHLRRSDDGGDGGSVQAFFSAADADRSGALEERELRAVLERPAASGAPNGTALTSDSTATARASPSRLTLVGALGQLTRSAHSAVTFAQFRD